MANVQNEAEFLLSTEPTAIEAGIGATANSRGYSISGTFLRGYEVVAYTGSGEDLKCDIIFKTGPKGILKAEQEAKHAFNRESKRDEDKRRAIAIRYIVSLDPTTIMERE